MMQRYLWYRTRTLYGKGENSESQPYILMSPTNMNNNVKNIGAVMTIMMMIRIKIIIEIKMVMMI